MILFLDRKQRRSSLSLVPFRLRDTVIFSLTAKVQLTEEEEHLVKLYNLKQATLVEGDAGKAFASAFRATVLLAVPVFLFLWNAAGWFPALGLTALGSIFCLFWIYNGIRETITVNDLIRGRTFKCESVVDLVRMEAYLKQLLNSFRQVVESSKNWGEAEQIEIRPLDPEDARLALL